MAEIPNRTLERAFSIMELLTRHPEGMALYELSNALSLPRSTTFNLAYSLVELGYVNFSKSSNKFALSLKLYEVGAHAVNDGGIMSAFHDCIADIHHQINETVHLGILAGKEVLYIAKKESTKPIRMVSYIGARAPLYCTALGKALLANMTDREIAGLYKETPFKAYTHNTITKLPALLSQMEHIRRQGFAVEREEHTEGVCCVAIAVCSPYRQEQYALSISAPIFRISDADVVRFSQLLLQARPHVMPFLQNGRNAENA